MALEQQEICSVELSYSGLCDLLLLLLYRRNCRKHPLYFLQEEILFPSLISECFYECPTECCLHCNAPQKNISTSLHDWKANIKHVRVAPGFEPFLAFLVYDLRV